MKVFAVFESHELDSIWWDESEANMHCNKLNTEVDLPYNACEVNEIQVRGLQDRTIMREIVDEIRDLVFDPSQIDGDGYVRFHISEAETLVNLVHKTEKEDVF